MAKQKRGRRSFAFDTPPRIAAWASVAGKKESEGPLQGYFDYTNTDTYFGEPSWEKAECRMQQLALETLLEDMDGIMEKSRQVTRSDWEHRPLLHRVLGGLLRPFAMWM